MVRIWKSLPERVFLMSLKERLFPEPIWIDAEMLFGDENLSRLKVKGDRHGHAFGIEAIQQSLGENLGLRLPEELMETLNLNDLGWLGLNFRDQLRHEVLQDRVFIGNDPDLQTGSLKTMRDEGRGFVWIRGRREKKQLKVDKILVSGVGSAGSQKRVITASYNPMKVSCDGLSVSISEAELPESRVQERHLDSNPSLSLLSTRADQFRALGGVVTPAMLGELSDQRRVVKTDDSATDGILGFYLSDKLGFGMEIDIESKSIGLSYAATEGSGLESWVVRVPAYLEIG
jgi:hypothetical protein